MTQSSITLLSLICVGLTLGAEAQSTTTVTGEIDPAALAQNGDTYVHRSDRFDKSVIKARAEQASKDGNFAAAFRDYLVVCDETEPESCYQAARIADVQGLGDVPEPVRVHLYQRACAAGYDLACSPSHDDQ